MKVEKITLKRKELRNLKTSKRKRKIQKMVRQTSLKFQAYGFQAKSRTGSTKFPLFQINTSSILDYKMPEHQLANA